MTSFNAGTTEMEQTTPTKPPEEDNRQHRIKRLKAKLINEEHRLVLMKKIRQSQTRPIATQQNQQQQLQTQNSNNQVNNNVNSLHNSSGKKLARQSTASSDMLSLQLNQQSNSNQLKTSGSLSNSSLTSSSRLLAGSSTSNPSSPYNRTPAHAHQRPKVNSLWNPPPQQARHPPPVGIAPPHVGNLSRQPITTPPNVVQAMMSNLTGSQSLLMNQIAAAAAAASRRNQQQQPSQPQSSLQNSLSKAQTQLLMQKRQSFKSATPKQQVEQTLLQHQQQTGSKPNLFSPNLAKRSNVGIASPHVGNMSRQPITTPPNVVQDIRNTISGQQSLLMNSNNLSAAAAAAAASASASRRNQSTQQISSASSFNKSQATQMLAQKKAAAKCAIQKQLEQTLMQLPQKQVQLGIDFLPNANNIEFVYYVGLEACVDYLTGSESPLDVQPLEKPFECSTCGTDFTPSWSWRRSNPVCENCVSNHVKKSLRNSQASRIKSLLIKAAKQEQEVEHKITAEAANVVNTPPTPTSSSSNSSQHSLLQPVSHQQQQQSRLSNSAQQNVWPRIGSSPLANLGNSSATNRTPNVQQQQQPVNTNPLGNLPPASLASLLQMNPQLGTIAASLMSGNNASASNNNTNQIAQVAALLMNQLAMNLYKR